MIWTPPEGMTPRVAASWRAFYRKAASGEAGYTISPAEYRLLYIAQMGRCWICQRAKGIHPDDPNGRGSRRLGVDHNHATGRVRGLLCTGGDKTCNRIIGWLDAAALKRAAEYVDLPPGRVLGEIVYQRERAREVGATMTDAECERLSVSYLWPER